MGEKMKQKLDHELEHVTFKAQDSVLKRVKHKSFRTKLSKWLNKEVEVPLVPVATTSLLLFVSITLNPFLSSREEPVDSSVSYKEELIEKGGSVYWRSWFMEVKQHENKNEN